MWRWTYKFLSSSAKSLHLLDQIFIQFNCINSYLPRMPSPLLDHLFTFFFLSQIFYIIVLHSALGNAVRAWGLVLVFFLWFIARSCQTPQPVLTPGQIWLPWTMPSLSVQWYTACCKLEASCWNTTLWIRRTFDRWSTPIHQLLVCSGPLKRQVTDTENGLTLYNGDCRITSCRLSLTVFYICPEFFHRFIISQSLRPSVRTEMEIDSFIATLCLLRIVSYTGCDNRPVMGINYFKISLTTTTF